MGLVVFYDTCRKTKYSYIASHGYVYFSAKIKTLVNEKRLNLECASVTRKFVDLDSEVWKRNCGVERERLRIREAQMDSSE